MLNTPTPEEISESQRQDNRADEIFKEFEHLKISASEPIYAAKPIVSINGSSISTEGNLTVISGDSKSGKSAACNVIMAGAINPPDNPYDGFDELNIAENSSCKAVLHFDTEQARHQHYKSLKNAVLKRVNLEKEPANFLSYNIRELPIKSYRYAVRALLLAASRRYGGIHLIVIDGIADFIKSVNDEESSNQIVSFFEKCAIEFKTAIIIIIHLNPGSEKQRGHLGSQLQRKAESILTVKKNGSVSHIIPQFLRGADSADIPQIQFQFDKEKGYHVSCGFLLKTNKAEENMTLLNEWATEVFSATPMSHKVAVEKLIAISSLSERTVKTKIKEMLDQNILEKTGKLYILKNSALAISDTEDDE
jgi:archaellum biogenesis ATPase FlaH